MSITDDESKQTVGCVTASAFLLLMIAASLVVGHFFGLAFGFAVLLIQVAAYMLLCVYTYCKGKDKDA